MKTIQDSLRGLDRAAMNAITYCKRSSPTRGLSVVYDLLPLHLHLTEKSLQTLVRHNELAHMSWSGYSHYLTRAISHRRHWMDLLEDSDIRIHSDRIRIPSPLNRFRVVTDSYSGATKFKTLSQINAFTDGSKTCTGTGSGYAIYEGRAEYTTGTISLPDHCSVFQSELIAIAQSALHILREWESLRCLLYTSPSPRD